MARKRKKSAKAGVLGTELIAGYARPCVTVDLVILTILDADLKILLIQREKPPYQGAWALPGGFVRVEEKEGEQGEDLEDAARRELTEETGLPAQSVYLEQMHTFGRAMRDPRVRVITVAYFALIRPDLAPFVEAGGDAAETEWFSVSELDEMALAFDHSEIIEYTLEHIQSRVDSSTLAFELVPKTFSIPELRSVYEIIKRTPYDPGNFRRRFKRMVSDGIIEEAPGKRITASKPAKVYRFQPPSQPAS